MIRKGQNPKIAETLTGAPLWSVKYEKNAVKEVVSC